MADDFVSNDTGSILQITCVDSTGVAINLTGATVRLRWIDTTNTVQTKTMTIVTAASGICQYQFATGELVPGRMQFEIEIEDSSGYKTTNPTLTEVTVREEIG